MQKKIFLALFIFIGFLLCVNINNCYASYEIVYNNNTYTVPDIPITENNSYYIIFVNLDKNNEPSSFSCYICSEPFKWIGHATNSDINSVATQIYSASYDLSSVESYSYEDENCPLIHYYYYSIPSSNNTWSYNSVNSLQGICNLGRKIDLNFVLTNNPENIYSVYFSGGGDIPWQVNQLGEDAFFVLAPQEEEQVQTILNTMTTSTDFSQVMAEVLTMLPILLVILILNLSLRKAIKILFELLGNA